jgi:hypothetical protein
MERWVAHRRPGWEERSPGQPDATLARIGNHIIPRLGNVALDRLRPVDVDDLYASWRAAGMAEATMRRMHAVPHGRSPGRELAVEVPRSLLPVFSRSSRGRVAAGGHGGSLP